MEFVMDVVVFEGKSCRDAEESLLSRERGFCNGPLVLEDEEV